LGNDSRSPSAASNQPSVANTAQSCSPIECSPSGPLRLLRNSWRSVEEYIQITTFLAFTNESLFRDPCIEELYQRHHMQQWAPRLDWSAVAFLQMLLWDLVANPPHRMYLVLRFHGAFIALVLVHKAVFLALRGRPFKWRKSRGALLCSFLLGRGLVCHPLLASAFPIGTSEDAKDSHGVRVATSLIGLGMTNLSAVLALQLHTLDTLLLCAAHGVACLCWAMLALHIPSGDAWHTLIAGHSLVACVCVWQQHEQERFDRCSFEQELLMERGLLLRSSDNLARQTSQTDFGMGVQFLSRARQVEHIHL